MVDGPLAASFGADSRPGIDHSSRSRQARGSDRTRACVRGGSTETRARSRRANASQVDPPRDAFERSRRSMPWCPKCRQEYLATVTSCADCGTALVADLAVIDAAADQGQERMVRILAPEKMLAGILTWLERSQ